VERSHAILKSILRLEERILADLLKALPLVSSKDTRLLLRELIRAKRGHIKVYKATIRAGEKSRTETPKKRRRTQPV